MPVLQVTMNRMLSANPVPMSPAWKQVCVWMRICIIKDSGIGLFFLSSDLFPAVLTMLYYWSHAKIRGAWKMGERQEKRKWSGPISYKLQTSFCFPVGWGSCNLTCVSSFLSLIRLKWNCQWVSVNWLTEWMGEQITLLNLPLLLLIITWVSSDHRTHKQKRNWL